MIRTYSNVPVDPARSCLPDLVSSELVALYGLHCGYGLWIFDAEGHHISVPKVPYRIDAKVIDPFRYDTPLADALRDEQEKGFRNATDWELLAFRHERADVYPVHALGSYWTDPLGYKRTLFLSMDKGLYYGLGYPDIPTSYAHNDKVLLVRELH